MTPAGAFPDSTKPGDVKASSKMGIPYRMLGRTGEKVSIIGLGGFHIIKKNTEEESIRIVRVAIDNGINFLDNCWDYNNGLSEIRMGKALLDGYRQKVFLMTKVDGQTGKMAIMQLEESLQRLQTDTIDLLQFHEVIRMADPERIFGSDGAIEALIKAKKAGKIRFIGFSGHKNPDIHLKMLQAAKENGFLFDTVQMPLNVMDAHFESFEKKVLPVLQKNNIGVLGMKPIGNNIILKSNIVTAVECLEYAMSLPVSTVITGCESLAILQQAIDTARNFQPLSNERRSALLARTAQAAANGQYEAYKTETLFDGTSRNPQWLG
jgi:predicted aldo/keto reductase-like oxidoreductase